MADENSNPLTIAERQLIIDTLKKRRAWLAKNPNQDVELLPVIDSIISKLGGTRSRSVEPDKIRILIAEDDEDCVALLLTLLEAANLTNVDIARDGHEAVNLLYNTPLPYQLILCDWNMPVKGGLEVLEALRASDRYLDALFIMVTAVSQSSQIRDAVEAGVDDYLVKPIDPDSFETKISRILEKL